MNYRVLEMENKDAPVLREVLDTEGLSFSRYVVLSLQSHCSYILKSQSVDDRLRRFPLSYYRTQ